jgi:hypothetical protein
MCRGGPLERNRKRSPWPAPPLLSLRRVELSAPERSMASRRDGGADRGSAGGTKRAALRLMRKLLRKLRVVPKLPTSSAFRQLRLTCPHGHGCGRTIRPRIPIKRYAVASARCSGQVGPVCPALPQHPCHRPQQLQPSPPPHFPIDAADLSSRSGDPISGSSRRCLTPELPWPALQPTPVAVTKPVARARHHKDERYQRTQVILASTPAPASAPHRFVPASFLRRYSRDSPRPYPAKPGCSRRD